MNKEQNIAMWLQEVLGNEYDVRYDACDSAMTRVYFKPLNKLIKEVRNEDLTGKINALEFEASMQDRLEAINKGLM